VPLSTQPWVKEQISNRDFLVFHLSLSVTGSFQHISDYLELLENSELNAMSVKYLKVVRASANPDANMTAELDIAVYSLFQAALAPAAN
jgi:hypothetical protein